MNQNYLIAQKKIKELQSQLEELLNCAPTDTFENKKGAVILENAIDKLDFYAYSLDRYSKPAVEGRLVYLDNRKFALIKKDGMTQVKEFSCGDYLEAYDKEAEEWLSGAVEHDGEDYYFKCPGMNSPKLYGGMKVRIRAG